MHLGLVTYNLAADWDLATLLQRCEATGFEGVELRTTHAHSVEESLNAEQRREVRQRFANSPVQLFGIGSIYEFHSLDQEVVRQNIEGAKRSLQLAHGPGSRRRQGAPQRPPGEGGRAARADPGADRARCP